MSAAGEIVERVLAGLHERPAAPSSTYRLQLTAQFGFRDAAALVPYLADLGITHVYLSPIATANPGSPHGYDVVDHNQLSPELGGDEGYAELHQACERAGLSILLDFVPNHMGIGRHNPWWQDVLENGPSSLHAPVFDIDWLPLKDELAYKVLVPVLGDQFGEVLERGELRLERDGGAFWIAYYDHRFPVAPRSVPRIVGHRLEELQARLPADDEGVMELLSIITSLEKLPTRRQVDPAPVAERAREKEVAKRRLQALFERSAAIRDHVDENVQIVNGTAGDPRSFDLLEGLLEQQAFRLAHWRVAGEEINYRRFFDINELAAIRMEDDQVFERTHRLLFDLLTTGRAAGVRVDHPDGLSLPTSYFRKLQEGYVLAAAARAAPEVPREELAAAVRAAFEDGRAGAPLYVVVEKILGGDERVPAAWCVHGTTGYEFLNGVNGLFVNRERARAVTTVYWRFLDERPEFDEIVFETKRLIMSSSMASEINMLAHRLNRISERDRKTRDFTRSSLEEALIQYIACLPIYRTYIEGTGAGDVDVRDRRYVESTIAAAKRRTPSLNASLFDFLRDILLLRHPSASAESSRAEVVEFVRKVQQVTGPVTAKAVEDTAFYRYNRLLSLNEVGGEPERFGRTVDEFHRMCSERLESWPGSLNTTSTHDTKRSEDVRLRIDALSEVPAEWLERLRRIARLARRHKSDVDGHDCPDRNEELLLYQTLVGAWPDDLDPSLPREHPSWVSFTERIQGYVEKALREAKVHTTWTNPNTAWDQGVRAFVAAILGSREILAELLPFQRRIAAAARVASLAQTVIKIAAPGVPDVYQGTELFDLSLVDPDNRRPVDFDLRRQALAEIARRLAEGPDARRALAVEYASGPALVDGRAKLLLLRETLRFRRSAQELFLRGSYIPLHVEGPHARHVVAFARRLGGRAAICVAPRLLVGKKFGPAGLEGHVHVPRDLSRPLEHVVTGERVRAAQGLLALSDVLNAFPVALLTL